MDDKTYNAACDVIDGLIGRWEKSASMYEELAGALGFDSHNIDNDLHPAILARARACKAAYDVVMKEVV